MKEVEVPAVPPPRTCSIDGCESRHKARGWCRLHYRRWRRRGDPLAGRRSPLARLLRRTDVTDDDGCWEWTGAIGTGGYGAFRFGGPAAVVRGAHRAAYTLLVGPIPDGLSIDHLCRNRACVNPSHLEAVTIKVNCLRGVGAPAVNARKTHCIRGHPLFGANLYVPPDGRRQCRECRKACKKAAHQRRREAGSQRNNVDEGELQLELQLGLVTQHLEILQCRECGGSFHAASGSHVTCLPCWKESKSFPLTKGDEAFVLMQSAFDDADLRVAELDCQIRELRGRIMEPPPTQLSRKTLMKLITLCHPDKHGDNPLASEMTKWLLTERGKSS